MGSSPAPAVTSHAANIQNGDTNTNASVVGRPNHANNTVMDAQTSVGGVAIATVDSAANVSGQMPAAAQSVPGYHTTATSQVQTSTQQAVQAQGKVPGNIQVADMNTYTQETTPGQHTAYAQVSSATTSAARMASHQSPTLGATQPTPSTEPGAKGVEVSSALQQGQTQTQTQGTVNSTPSTLLPMHTTLQMQAQAHMATYQSQQPQQTTHMPPQTYTQPQTQTQTQPQPHTHTQQAQPQQQQAQSSIPSQPVRQNQATTQGQVQTHTYTQQQQQGPPPQAQGIQPVQSQNATHTYQGNQARASPLAPPQTSAQPQANTYTQAQPTAYTPTQPQAYTQQSMNTYVQPQTHVQAQTQAFTPTSTSTQANVSPQVQAQGLVKTGGGPVPASHTNVTSNMSVNGSANTAGNTGVTSNRPSNASSTSMPAQSPYMHTNMGTSSPTPTTNTTQGNASPISSTTGAYAYITAPTLNAPGAGPNATTTYKPTPGSNASSPTVGATSRMSASTASGASPGTVTGMGTVPMNGASAMSGAGTQANASVSGTNGTAPFPMATSPAPVSTMTGGVGRVSGSGGVPPLYAASNTFTQTTGGNANTTANTTNTNTYTQKNTTYASSNTYAQATTPAGAPAGVLTYTQNTVQAKTVPNSGQTGATLGARVKDEPMATQYTTQQAKPLSAQELAAQSLASAGYGTSTLNTNTGAGVGTNQRSTASPGPQSTTMSTTYTTGATTASNSAYGSIPPVTAAPTHPTQTYTYTTTNTSTVPGTSTSANTNMNTDAHMNSNTIPSLNTPIGSPTALNQGIKMGGSSTSANGGYTKPNGIPTSANGAKPSYPAGPKLGPTTSSSSMMTTAVGMESDVEIPGENKEVRRAHHNALERKRRDHIKESFTSLRDQVPQLNGEKSSRAAILNSARDYITVLKGTNGQVEAEVDTLTKENMSLLDQIRALEAAIGPAAEPVYPGGPNCHTTEASPYAFQGLNGPVLNQGGLP